MAKKTPDTAFFSPVKSKSTGLKVYRKTRTGQFNVGGAAGITKQVKITKKGLLRRNKVSLDVNGIYRATLDSLKSFKEKDESPPSVEIVATHPPVHPGEILREEFMEPLGLTAYAIAKACKIPRSKLERIVREDLGISGDTAVRLGRFFGNSPQFWMNLQATYEVMRASQELGDAINEIEPYQHEAV